MAWDKLKTVDMISKMLSASQVRWDKTATELLIKKIGLKNATEKSVLREFMDIFGSAMRGGFEGDIGMKRLGENFARAYLKHNLKLDDKMKNFAMSNLTSKELSKLMSKTDQIGALEEIIDRKYKNIYGKISERQKELIADVKKNSVANGKQQLKLTAEEFLDAEVFERLTFEDKIKAFEDIKKEYTENFKSKGKRKKYVRENAVYNNTYAEMDDASSGIFSGLEPIDTNTSFEEKEYLKGQQEELKTTLKDEYGFTNKDFKKMHSPDDDRGLSFSNKKYGEREVYSAHNQKFKQKDIEYKKTRQGEIKQIVSDQSLTRNQRFAKLSVQQAQSFKKSPFKQFLSPQKKQNFAGIGRQVAKKIVKSEIKKGNTNFTDMGALRKQAKKKK